jgi:RimJ/RimL family protein N-acetyltransferase
VIIEPSNDTFRLVLCGESGLPDEPIASLSQPIVDACEACSTLYRRVGYVPPWVSYIALRSNTAVGGGAFVGPPVQDRVEIAYFTLPQHQGQGCATLTAQTLIAIARASRAGIEICAKTAPEASASTALLTQLGFTSIGITADDEIGEAWAWLLR